MEILYPMVVSAVAVLATLIYTSYLDIRDRRVPFIHWLPMLGIGCICTGYLLWQTTANLSLIFGYISLVASFLYADYLDNRGRTDSLGLTFYYKKSSIFYYLALVLILPVLSWFVFAPSVNMQLVPWYAMFAGIFSYISYMEYRGRFDENTGQNLRKREANVPEAISRWYFVLVVIIFAITAVLMLYTSGGWGSQSVIILLLAVFPGFSIFLQECICLAAQMHGHLSSSHSASLRSRSHLSLVCRRSGSCHSPFLSMPFS